MRITTFLCALSLVAVVLVAETSSYQHSAPVPIAAQSQPRAFSASDGVQMWRRAEIEVVPLDIAVANRAEIESLRRRVERVEADAVAGNVYLTDPAVRERLTQQLQLIRALMSYAERRDSDQGKSQVALQVQHHLNRIEGRIACESCHPSAVTRADSNRP
jgi:hypothetical protein